MSIYVAIEVFKTIQVRAIHSDTIMNKKNLELPPMADDKEAEEARNEKVQVRNSEVLENLGEINLLLTDKTGTLTKNQMILRNIYCDNRVWEMEATEGFAG